MNKIVLILVSFIFISLNLHADNNTKSPSVKKEIVKHSKKRKKFKPFLITSGIPHLTAVINIGWEDEDLNLTDAQKKELVKIRKKTLMSLKDLKLEVKELEEFIIESVQDDESKKELFSMVEELGELKIKATKIHIECVQDTKKVLTKDQIKYVMEQF